MYYVFNFGAIEKDNEKEYISSIISNCIQKPKLRDLTSTIISECHQYLRKKYDFSITSLRELKRFNKLFIFFQNYFENKENIKNKETIEILSIIISIYLCYYIREIDKDERTNFEQHLNQNFKKLVN